jgi:hypothetical protein
MRNVSEKRCRGKSKHKFYVQRKFPENRAIYETMWENTAQQDRLQTKIQNGACALYAG